MHINRADFDAQPDLNRVHPAQHIAGAARRAEGLRHQILKMHAAALVACRVDVRDVVADYIHLRLMRLQTGDSRKHRLPHSVRPP
jgi:hypothetical protein